MISPSVIPKFSKLGFKLGLTTICENFKLEEIFLAVTNEDINVLVPKTVLGKFNIHLS